MTEQQLINNIKKCKDPYTTIPLLANIWRKSSVRLAGESFGATLMKKSSRSGNEFSAPRIRKNSVIYEEDYYYFYEDIKTYYLDKKYVWYKHVYDSTRNGFKAGLQPVYVNVK